LPGGPFNPASSISEAPLLLQEAKSDFHDSLLNIADQMEPGIRGTFLSAVEMLRESLTVEELVEALKSGTFSAIDNAMSWSGFRIELQKVESVLLQGAQLAIDKAAGQMASLIDFDLSVVALQGRAARLARAHGASLVANVSENTRTAIQTLVGGGLGDGETWDKMARRLKPMIGLDASRAKAFNKYILEVQDEVSEATERVLTAKQIQAKIDKRYKELIADRAETIARTESWDAIQGGQIQVWDQARDEGFPVEGLDAYFISTSGERILRSPVHPRCLCTARLRRQVDSEGNVFYVRQWVLAPRACEICRRFKGALALPEA
jgi:hypothetical protein